MEPQTPDVMIRGAGPAGSALALMLAAHTRTPERIVLVRPASAAPHDTGTATGATASPAAAQASSAASNTSEAAADPRALALNHGSRALLEQIGAWPQRCADILTVHVSQRERLGRTLIRHDELDVPRLGSVVTYDDLDQAMRQAVAGSGVRCIPADAVDTGPQAARVQVQADGARAQGLRRHYQQHALLATIKAQHAMPGWAFERFTDEGPLAILPHPQGPHYFSLVWCTTPQRADGLRGLDPQSLAQSLQEAFGDRLGALRLASEPALFPLLLDAGPQRLGQRRVAIGNAAQTLHPVAGQGLNLGLRDAAQLAHALTPWLRDTARDPSPALDRFIAMRRADRWLTIGITDLLPRLFATRNPLRQHACGLGLLGLDLAPPLRRAIASQLLLGLRS